MPDCPEFDFHLISGSDAIQRFPHLFALRGEVINCWGALEFEMVRLYAHCFKPLEQRRDACTLFMAVFPLPKRIDLLVAECEERLAVDQFQRLSKALAEIQPLAGWRNIFAHGLWAVTDTASCATTRSQALRT